MQIQLINSIKYNFMRSFFAIILLLVGQTAQAEYTWWTYNERTQVITFGTQKSDFSKDERTFNLMKYPLNVTIDSECDIAYVVEPRWSSKFVSIFDLSESTHIERFEDCELTSLCTKVSPFSISLGCKIIQRRRSLSSRTKLTISGRFWELYTQYYLNKRHLNFIEFVCVKRKDDLAFDHAINGCDAEIILRMFEGNFTPEAMFETALEAANPYAYALMYLAFKHGLWDTNESPILAEVFKEGADKITIEVAEENLNLIRDAKK